MSKKMDVRQRTTAVLVAFAVLLLIALNLIQWYVYGQVRSFMELRISDEVEGLAKSIAGKIDPRDLEPSVDGRGPVNGLWLVAAQLENAQMSNGLLGINLYDTRGRDMLAADTVQDSGDVLLNLAEFVSADAGISAVTPVYRSDSLYLLSAFVPVFGTNDSIVAVLRAEAGYAVFKTIEGFRKSIILANVVSALFVVLSLSALVIINRKLLATHQALLRASAISSMGEMAATIAHEIRNPLAIIRNSAERIRKKYGADSTDPVFRFIPDEVDRMNRIVSGYLDFAHPARSDREEFSVRDMLIALIDGMRTDLAAANVEAELRFESTDDSYKVNGERYAVRQAVLNIVLNAKSAQPKGGSIDIAVSSNRRLGGEAVAIEVADRGPGFSRNAAERAFDPFFTTRDKGSGLGLYIARSVIDGHGGSIAIGNRDGGGASVTITIPKGM